MQNLLKIATKCIDEFSRKENVARFAAIIGGEAVILHGIPRTTLDIDILFFCGDEEKNISHLAKLFASFLRQELGDRFEIKDFEASKDPSDPLIHDLVIITDAQREFKKLDILIANYAWELEGFRAMDTPHAGPLQPYPRPYLAAMKLMAGGAQDEEDIRNLFLVMSESEKEKAYDLARSIKRDKNLSRILTEGRRPSRIDENDILQTLKRIDDM